MLVKVVLMQSQKRSRKVMVIKSSCHCFPSTSSKALYVSVNNPDLIFRHFRPNHIISKPILNKSPHRIAEADPEKLVHSSHKPRALTHKLLHHILHFFLQYLDGGISGLQGGHQLSRSYANGMRVSRTLSQM
jgi:hypothetical protein